MCKFITVFVCVIVLWTFEIFSTNVVRRKIAVLRFQQDYDLFWVQKFNRQNKYRSQTMRRCHFPPKTPSHFPTQPIFSLSSPFSLSSAVLMAEWILPWKSLVEYYLIRNRATNHFHRDVNKARKSNNITFNGTNFVYLSDVNKDC